MQTLLLKLYQNKHIIRTLVIIVSVILAVCAAKEFIVFTIAAFASLFRQDDLSESEKQAIAAKRAQRALDAAEAVRKANEAYEKSVVDAKTLAGKQRAEEVDRFLDKEF